jgi:hypothetical protein
MDDIGPGQGFAGNPCQVFLQGVKSAGKMTGPGTAGEETAANAAGSK